MQEIIFKIITAVITFIAGTNIDMKGVEVSNGDGLYKDEYEEGRYIYKGENPNNYLLFNNELWRIMALEQDGTLKIIRNEIINNQAFDENNQNKWTSSSLNKYLNNDYYNSLSTEAKSLIKIHKFNIGSIGKTNNNSLAAVISDEQTKTWIGYIGLINVSDYLKSTSDKKCATLFSLYQDHSTCYKSNYISDGNYLWSISEDYATNNVITVGNTYFGDSEPFFDNIGVLPTLYLKSNIELKGQGTLNRPYEIK